MTDDPKFLEEFNLSETQEMVRNVFMEPSTEKPEPPYPLKLLLGVGLAPVNIAQGIGARSQHVSAWVQKTRPIPAKTLPVLFDFLEDCAIASGAALAGLRRKLELLPPNANIRPAIEAQVLRLEEFYADASKAVSDWKKFHTQKQMIDNWTR